MQCSAAGFLSSKHLKQLQPVKLCTEHCAASTCRCCSWCATIHILKSQFLLVYLDNFWVWCATVCKGFARSISRRRWKNQNHWPKY